MVEHITKQIENGELLPKRFSQEESRTIGGIHTQAEAHVTTGSTRNVEETQRINQGK